MQKQGWAAAIMWEGAAACPSVVFSSSRSQRSSQHPGPPRPASSAGCGKEARAVARIPPKRGRSPSPYFCRASTETAQLQFSRES